MTWLYRTIRLTGHLGVALLVLLGSFGSAFAFTDTVGHWADQDISLLASHEMLGGYPDGSFQPSRNVTRAEFAKIIVRALNREQDIWSLEAVPTVFSDVGPKHWAKGYIQLAYEMGIILGYDDSTFRPSDFIRRQEIALILVRALNYKNNSPGVQLPFSDAGQIPDWARDGIAVATQRMLLGGFPDGTFRPAAPATRAEAAVLIARFLGERGGRYNFYGTISAIDHASLKMTVSLAGEKQAFQYQAGVQVFQSGKMLPFAELRAKLPAAAYFNLDESGQISFIQLAAAPVVNPISLVMEGARETLGSAAPGVTGSSFEITAVDQLPALLPGTSFPDGTDPDQSLALTRAETGAVRLANRTGADGRGQLIAIIDTGVDPAHPDLQITSASTRKIRDWIDLTGEGRIDTTQVWPAGREKYDLGGFSYTLKGLPSKSGSYHYGFLEEQPLGLDLNFNGRSQDRFLVVVADPTVAGRYDTAYIDTDGDQDLSDQTGMGDYSSDQRVVFFVPGFLGRSFGFVVSRIAENGSAVTLGFDANGHGTQVAGISAAAGRVKGMAPGAELLVIKAVNARGETSMNLLTEGVRQAAAAGARIINLSLGNYGNGTTGTNPLTQLIDELSKKGITFTVAAGNKGPGLNSLGTPGDARSAISVGAYLSPGMWRMVYGYQVSRDTLWAFSSSGPRLDGMMAPAVSAPGSVISTAPTWMGQPYMLIEGTSAAAPHAAGAVALLLDSAARSGIAVNPVAVKNAVVLGARQIPHFSQLESGFGALDVDSAWDYLRSIPPPPALQGLTFNRLLGLGEGMFARGFIPGQISYRLINSTGWPVQLFWRSTVEWMQPEFGTTLIPSGIARYLPVKYQVPQQPGLYTGFLEGDAPGTPGVDLRLMATVIQPYPLSAQNGYRQKLTDNLEAGQHRRYFFRVPEGAGQFQVSLAISAGSGGRLQGRADLHLFRPDGTEQVTTDFAGVGPEGTVIRSQVTATVDKPQTGVWEAVVYSSAALSTYGQQDSQYSLEAALYGAPAGRTASPSSWLVGVVPKLLVPGQSTYLTLQVRDRETLRPVNDMMEINGRLFEVRGGLVTFPITPQADRIQVQIRTN